MIAMNNQNSIRALAQAGKFEEIMSFIPERIYFADDEHRLIITSGISKTVMPSAVLYSVNYCIQYDSESQLFYILKNRNGELGYLKSLLRDLVGIELNYSKEYSDVLTFTCEEDKVIAKLKGFLCLRNTKS